MQSFANENYLNPAEFAEQGNTPCPDWEINQHCGVDIVSYSDLMWLWQIDEGLSFVNGNRTYDWNTGRLSSGECAAWQNGHVEDANNSQVRFEALGLNSDIPGYHSSTRGRVVFSVFDGQVTQKSNYQHFTLKMIVGMRIGPFFLPWRNMAGDNLEIQYTHLSPNGCQGYSGPIESFEVGDVLPAGRRIGCYNGDAARFRPHLHVTLKLIKSNSSAGDFLCAEQPPYLNPYIPGCGAPSLPRPHRNGEFPIHIQEHGTIISDSSRNWEESPISS